MSAARDAPEKVEGPQQGGPPGRNRNRSGLTPINQRNNAIVARSEAIGEPTLPGLLVDLKDTLTQELGEPEHRLGRTVWPRCPSPEHRGIQGVILADDRATLWRCFGCGAGGDVYDVVRLRGGPA